MCYVYSNMWRQYEKSKFEDAMCEYGKMNGQNGPSAQLSVQLPLPLQTPTNRLFSFDYLSKLCGRKIQEGRIKCLYSI